MSLIEGPNSFTILPTCTISIPSLRPQLAPIGALLHPETALGKMPGGFPNQPLGTGQPMGRNDGTHFSGSTDASMTSAALTPVQAPSSRCKTCMRGAEQPSQRPHQGSVVVASQQKPVVIANSLKLLLSKEVLPNIPLTKLQGNIIAARNAN